MVPCKSSSCAYNQLLFINRKRIPPNYEPFLQCSHSCGQGVKHRAVSCHRVNTYGWPDPDPVSHGCNSTEKPPEVETCTINAANCKTNKVMWKVGPWSQVSVPPVSSAMNDALHYYSRACLLGIFWNFSWVFIGFLFVNYDLVLKMELVKLVEVSFTIDFSVFMGG